jgi:hypothetical protein
MAGDEEEPGFEEQLRDANDQIDLWEGDLSKPLARTRESSRENRTQSARFPG